MYDRACGYMCLRCIYRYIIYTHVSFNFPGRPENKLERAKEPAVYCAKLPRLKKYVVAIIRIYRVPSPIFIANVKY